MAKSAAAETGQEVATATSSAGLPAGMDNFDVSELEGLSGLGYSEKAEDSLVPIISILQDNSGEVKKGHSKKIDGAEAGYFIIRSLKKILQVTKPEPLVIIPAAFTHAWVQWRGEPGEGQVIKQYPFDDRPAEAEEKPDPNNKPGEDRTIWVMPNGDRLVDTRYHFCHALIDGSWMAVVVPMGGTNHTTSRSWTAQMKAVRIQGKPVPAWFKKYGLSPQFQQRGNQSWYTYNIEDLGWVEDAEMRAAGRQLFESVQGGVLSPENEAAAAAEAASSGVDSSADAPI